MQQIISKSQFKAQMLDFFRQLEKTKQPLIITHSGKPVAKVIPYKSKSDQEAILKSLRGTITYHGDIVEPLDVEWDALK